MNTINQKIVQDTKEIYNINFYSGRIQNHIPFDELINILNNAKQEIINKFPEASNFNIDFGTYYDYTDPIGNYINIIFYRYQTQEEIDIEEKNKQDKINYAILQEKWKKEAEENKIKQRELDKIRAKENLMKQALQKECLEKKINQFHCELEHLDRWIAESNNQKLVYATVFKFCAKIRSDDLPLSFFVNNKNFNEFHQYVSRMK